MELALIHQAKTLEGPTTLDDLIDQVEAEGPRYEDHVGIPLRGTRVEDDGAWRFNGSAGRLTRHSLTQLCSRLRLADQATVPASYMARCPSPLAAENLNHWISTLPREDVPEVFVRTQDRRISGHSTVRAVLSRRYAVADHRDLLLTLREMLPGHGLRIAAWSLDDEQLTLRLMVDCDYPPSMGDPLRVGLHLTNSEIGLGRISVMGLITRLVCSNGLIVNVAELGAVHRRHVGRAGESLEGVIREGLTRVLADTHEAARRFVLLREIPAPQPIDQFMERTAKEHGLPELIVGKALYGMRGGTLYDVVNAFTSAAQQFPVSERLLVETAMSRFLDLKTAVH